MNVFTNKETKVQRALELRIGFKSLDSTLSLPATGEYSMLLDKGKEV